MRSFLPDSARPPGSEHLVADQHATGTADGPPQVLAVRLLGHDRRPVSRLEEQVERAEQGHHSRDVGRGLQRREIRLEDRPLLALDDDRDDVVGPPRLHVLDRPVDVLRDLLRRRRPEQSQDGPHRVECRIEPLGGSPPALDPLEDRGRGAGLQLQPALEGREAERLLVEVLGLADPAPALVRRGQPAVELGRHLTLHDGLRGDVAHLVRDPVEGVEHGDAGLLERPGGVEDALGRVGLRPRRHGPRDGRRLGPAVDVGRPAQRPGRELVVGPMGGTAQRQGPGRAVGAGVLDAEVEDRGVVATSGLDVELLGVHPERQHLLAGDLHASISPYDGAVAKSLLGPAAAVTCHRGTTSRHRC